MVSRQRGEVGARPAKQRNKLFNLDCVHLTFVNHGSSGPLSSVMTNRFGFQPVVMVGGLLISSGTIATSFTTSVNQMYITYGLVSGIELLSL